MKIGIDPDLETLSPQFQAFVKRFRRNTQIVEDFYNLELEQLTQPEPELDSFIDLSLLDLNTQTMSHLVRGACQKAVRQAAHGLVTQALTCLGNLQAELAQRPAERIFIDAAYTVASLNPSQEEAIPDAKEPVSHKKRGGRSHRGQTAVGGDTTGPTDGDHPEKDAGSA